MHKLKSNQLGHWCSFCEPKTTKAVYREISWNGHFACSEHTEELIKVERSRSSDRYTEADYQTWMRV